MNRVQSLGTSPFPALSPERIAAARELHGPFVDTYLEQLQVGDTLADNLVASFDKLPRGEGYGMLKQAIRTGIDSVDNPSDELVALFAQVDHVPDWVNWEQMKAGSTKILQNALLPALSLTVYGLPHAYLATGNKPSMFTNAITRSTVQRFAVSTRFFTEVFLPGNLERRADGFKFTLLTRILHAQVRRRILASGRWDVTLGLPINQTHMAIANTVFSLVTVDGVRRLGGRINQEEMDSVLATWRYVGYLIGTHPEMMWSCEEEARRLMEVGYSLECDPDEDAKILCQALIESSPSGLGMKDGYWARKFVAIMYSLSRRLLGDTMADRLGYPKGRHRLICSLGTLIWRVWGRFPKLIPPKLRHYMGMNFWIERGDYDFNLYRF